MGQAGRGWDNRCEAANILARTCRLHVGLPPARPRSIREEAGIKLWGRPAGPRTPIWLGNLAGRVVRANESLDTIARKSCLRRGQLVGLLLVTVSLSSVTCSSAVPVRRPTCSLVSLALVSLGRVHYHTKRRSTPAMWNVDTMAEPTCRKSFSISTKSSCPSSYQRVFRLAFGRVALNNEVATVRARKCGTLFASQMRRWGDRGTRLIPIANARTLEGRR